MWKVFLAFVTHRLFLFMVAAVSLNAISGGTLSSKFLTFVSHGPEATEVEGLARQSALSVVSQTRNPFHWLCVWGSQLSGFSPALVLLVLSNVFLLFLLWEAYALFSRMVTTDVATLAAIFVLLWPTSYELSLGSSLTMVGFLFLLSLRQALEQVWWLAGVAGAGVALVDPIALGALPAYLYLFWSVQRFLTAKEWGRNLAFFLVPIALGAMLSGDSWGRVIGGWNQSALFDLFRWGTQDGSGFFSKVYAGQTLALIFLFLGAVGALFSNVNPLHRFLPMFVVLALVASTPYAMLASRVPLAGICMEGIASSSSGISSRIVSAMMIGLGAYEVYALFGA